MMEARNQPSLLDVAGTAPDVNIRPSTSAFGNAASIFIRGIGQYKYYYLTTFDNTGPAGFASAVPAPPPMYTVSAKREF
jgi:hypothetical protein